jgi:para-nitrobenzyl esterase
MPAMYKLNEQVMCRRRAEGDQQWGFYVGLWSPKLPHQVPGCE